MSTLAPYVLVRVAELPVETLGCVDGDARRAVRHLDELDKELCAHREDLSQRLHDAVPTASRDRRRQLLDWKRAVHSGRTGEAVPAQTGRDLDGRMRAWNDLARRYDAALNTAEGALAADRERRLAAMQETWSSERFRTALLFASPDLYAGLSRQASSGRTRRRVEEATLAYHVRAATKTSPFARFTAIGAATVGNKHSGWEKSEPLSVTPAVELNAVVAEHLAAALEASPSLRQQHFVMPNPTLVRDNGSLLVLRRHRTPAGTRIAAADERFVRVEHGRAVACALGLASEQRLTTDELARALGESLENSGGQGQLRAFVEQLIDAGVVELDTGFANAEPDAVARYAEKTPYDAGRDQRAIAAACGAIARELANIADAPPAAQVTALDSIRQQIGAATVAAGDGVKHVSNQGLVFLTGVVHDRLSLDALRLAPAERALSSLSHAVLAFDAGFVMRRVAFRYFLQTAGEHGRVPLTSFLADFYTDCYRPLFGRSTESPVWDPFDPLIPAGLAPEVEALAVARERFADSCLTSLGGCPDGPLELPEALLGELAAAAAPHWPPPLEPSIGFFAQLCRNDPDQPYELAVNQVVPGYGSYVARYCDERVYGDLGGSLRQQTAQRLASAAEGAELAEVVATIGFNGQMHEALTPSRIPYPGEAVGDREQRALPWQALDVAHWPAGNMLVLVDTRDARRYLPFSPGPLAPHHVPLACRMLTALGPSLIPDFSLLDLLEHRRGETSHEVRSYPEVRVGPLVLLRRTWRMPASSLPTVKTDELARFRALRAWAAALDLPRCVFVTPMRLPDILRVGRTPARVRRLYKPFWLDLDDPLSCRLLWRYCGEIDSMLTIAEALPSPRDSLVRRQDGTHASELFLECWPGPLK